MQQCITGLGETALGLPRLRSGLYRSHQGDGQGREQHDGDRGGRGGGPGPAGGLQPGDSAATNSTMQMSPRQTILSYGTFGMWGALLAGGRTVISATAVNTKVMLSNIGNFV